jgi:hypothetical protein
MWIIHPFKMAARLCSHRQSAYCCIKTIEKELLRKKLSSTIEEKMQCHREVKQWLDANRSQLQVVILEEEMVMLEAAVVCVKEIEELSLRHASLSSLCVLPQALQWATEIRSAASLFVSRERIVMLSARIVEMHMNLNQLIEGDNAERAYDRAGKQRHLDSELARCGLKRASHERFTPGDCFFDALSFCLRDLNEFLSSVTIRREAMQTLGEDYSSGLEEALVVADAMSARYSSFDEYLHCMSSASSVCLQPSATIKS